MQRSLAILLSVCLGLFLADAFVSLVDDSLALLLGTHVLMAIRTLVFLFAGLAALMIYLLMGLTPTIPKRQFLPLTLSIPAAQLAVFPILIFFYGRLQQIAWVFSLFQMLFGLGILWWVQGGFKLRWPLVEARTLPVRRFSWRNLIVFLSVNLFVLLPAVIIYLIACAAVAVDHFSAGFVALRPTGLTVQVRTYVRDDGKTIRLVPMAHIGEPEFYRTLSRSFPTNALILMEGVTDHRNLLTNKITYQRMATALGVAEQHEEFQPRGELVHADVDIEVFSSNTIAGLNLVMLLHAKGLNADTVLKLMRFSPPHFEQQLFDDLLKKRNRRVLEEIQTQLQQSETIIVPWGAAHMPEIAREIQKTGFQVQETQEYVAIQFGSAASKGKRDRKK